MIRLYRTAMPNRPSWQCSRLSFRFYRHMLQSPRQVLASQARAQFHFRLRSCAIEQRFGGESLVCPMPRSSCLPVWTRSAAHLVVCENNLPNSARFKGAIIVVHILSVTSNLKANDPLTEEFPAPSSRGSLISKMSHAERPHPASPCCCMGELLFSRGVAPMPSAEKQPHGRKQQCVG